MQGGHKAEGEDIGRQQARGGVEEGGWRRGGVEQHAFGFEVRDDHFEGFDGLGGRLAEHNHVRAAGAVAQQQAGFIHRAHFLCGGVQAGIAVVAHAAKLVSLFA